MSEYEQWLVETVEWHKQRCLDDAAERGYPGKIHLSDLRLQDIYEAYEHCLEKYRELSKANERSGDE